MKEQSTQHNNAIPARKVDALEGILERITFFNEENNFIVARLRVGQRYRTGNG